MKRMFICATLLSCLLATTASATSSTGVTYSDQTVGGVSMKVVVVDTKNPNIETKVVLEDNTINTTDSFADIVAEQDAVVSINGNFFDAYSDYKRPIGNVMSQGEMLYSAAGLPNLGITTDGELCVGMPGYFIRLTVGGGQSFLAYDVNEPGQFAELPRLYTSAFGTSVTMTQTGTAYIFQDDTLTAAQPVAPGAVVTIPANGMVLFQGSAVESWAHPANPDSHIGDKVDVSYFLQLPDGETKAAFDGKEMDSLLAGNARLVTNGAVDCSTFGNENPNDPRWTGAAPRTAVGKLSDGKLLIVSAPSATLQGLAGAMVSLGCVDAVNLDGGASRAMAIDGTVVAAPGRELTVTFHVYDTSEPAPAPVAKHPFTDVAAGAYYENAVVWALESGVTTGMTATTFAPGDTCTRGQVVTFLWRACGKPAPASTENPFTDVSSDSPYYQAILWAVGEKITAGMTATTFEPGTKCTTGQVLTFLHRANGAPDAGQSDTADLYPGRYFTNALAWASNTGLLSAVTDTLNPDGDSPRAHIVSYLCENAK